MKAYDEMLSLMQLSGLQRTTALRLIEGVELEQTATELSVSFLTVVPFFKVSKHLQWLRTRPSVGTSLLQAQERVFLE